MHIMMVGEKHLKVIIGLPDTASYQGQYFDEPKGIFTLYVTDESFDEVPLGGIIPLLTPTIERLNGHTN